MYELVFAGEAHATFAAVIPAQAGIQKFGIAVIPKHF